MYPGPQAGIPAVKWDPQMNPGNGPRNGPPKCHFEQTPQIDSLNESLIPQSSSSTTLKPFKAFDCSFLKPAKSSSIIISSVLTTHCKDFLSLYINCGYGLSCQKTMP